MTDAILVGDEISNSKISLESDPIISVVSSIAVNPFILMLLGIPLIFLISVGVVSNPPEISYSYNLFC